MNPAHDHRALRRDELIARCLRERHQLIASTAVALAAIPRARRIARTLRGLLRMYRILAGATRDADA